jgi:hypothetical protein
MKGERLTPRSPNSFEEQRSRKMTKIASDVQIEAFNLRKGSRSFEELGNDLMISPDMLTRFAQKQQFQDETTFDKIVTWIESGKRPQPPVG